MQNFDHVERGWQAVDRTGGKIGTIEEIGANYFVVSKGLIFTKDIYIPVSRVTATDPGEGMVRIDVDKDQLDGMGWDQPPLGTGMAADTDTAYGTTDDPAYATSTATTSYAAPETAASYDTSRTANVDDSVRVSLHEEQLRAGTVKEHTGEVAVTKNVVEEQQTIDVPVTREQVEVKRFAVDRPADASDISNTDTIRVPVSAERVEVSKDARVVEEIEISKHAVTGTQRVSDTVRREEVNIEQDGDVTLADDSNLSSAKRRR